MTVASYNDQSKVVTLSAALPAPSPVTMPVFVNYDWQYTTVALTSFSPLTPANNTSEFVLQAANAGLWGNSAQASGGGLLVQITPSSRTQAQVQGITVTFDVLALNSAYNFYPGAIVEINSNGGKSYGKIKAVLGSSLEMTASLAGGAAISADLTASHPVTVRTCEFDINVSYNGAGESFRGLTLDNTTPYYYANAILNGSNLLSVPASPPSDQISTDPRTMPVASDGLNVLLAGGTDGDYPLPADFAGSDMGPGNRTGIAALIDAQEISIIAAPGITDQTTQMALITQCETVRYRFAILDPAPTSYRRRAQYV